MNSESAIETHYPIDEVFNPDNISLTKIKAYGATGSKVVNVNDKRDRSSFTMNTPKIFTFGAQQVTETKGDEKIPIPNKYTLNMQFPEEETDRATLTKMGEAILNKIEANQEDVLAAGGVFKYLSESEKETMSAFSVLRLRTNLEAFYEYITTVAVTKSAEWFGREIPRSAVEFAMNPMFRFPKVQGSETAKDYTRPPSLSVKIPFWKKNKAHEDRWPTSVFSGEDCSPLFVDGMPEFAGMTPIQALSGYMHIIGSISCSGIWFSNDKLSITWNLTEAITYTSKAKATGKCSLINRARISGSNNSHNPEHIEDPNEPPSPPASASASKNIGVEIEGDESECDESEGEDEPPAPSPKAPTPPPVAAPEPEATAKPAAKRRQRKV